MRQIVGTFAQLEKDLMATRLRNSRQFKRLERGIKASGNAPFGYRYEGHGFLLRVDFAKFFDFITLEKV